jgi:hypothetical protein
MHWLTGFMARTFCCPGSPVKISKSFWPIFEDEFRPEGRMENEIVFDLAHFRWQKYRIHQMYIAATYSDPFVSDLVDARQKSWAGMRSHLRMKSINRRTISEIENELLLEQAKESAKILAKAMREGKLVNSEIVQG